MPHAPMCVQGFLDFFIPGGEVLQDKLLKAVCTIYPWTKNLPLPVKVRPSQPIHAHVHVGETGNHFVQSCEPIFCAL
eukprot:362159-Chlamydomonas_euryale.AAC.19